MGISRDSIHKRRATGGKQKQWRKKRKYEMGRQPANTKLSSNKTVRRIRVRGGNVKWRALRLDTGNYSWGSEATTRKTRVLDVVYNASNNELVRTKTLVKSAIVQVDAAPFKQWYLSHYGVELGRKKKSASSTKKDGEEGEEAAVAAPEEVKKSNHLLRKIASRQEGRSLDSHIEDFSLQSFPFIVVKQRLRLWPHQLSNNPPSPAKRLSSPPATSSKRWASWAVAV